MPAETARTRRSLTARELAVWRDFIETTEVLRAQVAARMQRECGLSLGDYAVLLALSEADHRCMRSSQLAQTIGWERSRLSHHLARMQQRGLIDRRDTEGDNRGTEVALTTAGADAFRRASAPHLQVVRALFVEAFDAEQFDRIAGLTAALRTHLVAETCVPEDAGDDC